MVDGSALRRVVLSVGHGGPQVTITAVGTGPGAALPSGAVRFGPADGFEPGQTTMDLVLSAPADVSGGRSLVVEGENGSGQPIVLVIRIDDAVDPVEPADFVEDFLRRRDIDEDDARIDARDAGRQDRRHA